MLNFLVIEIMLCLLSKAQRAQGLSAFNIVTGNPQECQPQDCQLVANPEVGNSKYESIATVGEIRVWWRADFQSGSRVLKKVF